MKREVKPGQNRFLILLDPIVKNVQLVKLDPAIEASLTKDPAYLKAMIEDDWARVADLVHRVVGSTLTAVPMSVDQVAWDGYFVVDTDTRDVVGSCGFKGQPTGDGTVEIAYFTYPGFEGQGYATSMATKLLQLADGCAAVSRVIAHTLPEENASTSVLKKVDMGFVGEVIGPDDGRIWQWQRAVGDN